MSRNPSIDTRSVPAPRPPERRDGLDPALAFPPPQPLGRAKSDVADRAERRPEPSLSREVPLTLSEAKLLWDIGRFRTVATEDLEKVLYRRDQSKAAQDLESLSEKGFLQRHTVLLNQNRGKLSVVVLTRAGQKHLQRLPEAAEQAVYAGFVKPAEVAHDAAIYRMFQKEAALIAKEGGTVRRVVLDYELKRRIYSPLAKVRHLPPREYAKAQAEVARANALRVVGGKIPLPDLRLEYETSEGDRTHVDLELATHHYHGSHLETKVAAGFKLYADGGGRGTKPLEERELSAEIFSL